MKIDRTLRYGGYATLAIALVVAFVAGLNLLVERLPWRADMTAEGFFSLSDQTRKVLAAADSPITVLGLWEAGKEDARVVELLGPLPGRVGAPAGPAGRPLPKSRRAEALRGGRPKPPAVGSLVFDTGSRFKVLRLRDLYEVQVDPKSGEEVPTAFIGESAITNAIASVTAAKDPVVYLLRGHGEKSLRRRWPTACGGPSTMPATSPCPSPAPCPRTPTSSSPSRRNKICSRWRPTRSPRSCASAAASCSS